MKKRVPGALIFLRTAQPGSKGLESGGGLHRYETSAWRGQRVAPMWKGRNRQSSALHETCLLRRITYKCNASPMQCACACACAGPPLPPSPPHAHTKQSAPQAHAWTCLALTMSLYGTGLSWSPARSTHTQACWRMASVRTSCPGMHNREQ